MIASNSKSLAASTCPSAAIDVQNVDNYGAPSCTDCLLDWPAFLNIENPTNIIDIRGAIKFIPLAKYHVDSVLRRPHIKLTIAYHEAQRRSTSKKLFEHHYNVLTHFLLTTMRQASSNVFEYRPEPNNIGVGFSVVSIDDGSHFFIHHGLNLILSNGMPGMLMSIVATVPGLRDMSVHKPTNPPILKPYAGSIV